jgi:hypothetical protein
MPFPVEVPAPFGDLMQFEPQEPDPQRWQDQTNQTLSFVGDL